jgi:N-acyl-D-aspartate/D-glutamate deacylase
LRKGAAADIAMFNLQAVSDTGTLQSPNQLARGTVNVIVNGVVAWRDGRLTDARGGAVLTSS